MNHDYVLNHKYAFDHSYVLNRGYALDDGSFVNNGHALNKLNMSGSSLPVWLISAMVA